MYFAPLVSPTFDILLAAIIAVWLRPVTIRNVKVSPALILLAVATLSGLATGYVTVAGAVALTLYVGIAYFATQPQNSKLASVALTFATGALSLLLATHLLPGFHNPMLLDHVKIVGDAIPYTLYANFDKAVVGVVLVLFFSKRVTSLKELGTLAKRSIPLTFFAVVVVLAAALTLHLVRFEYKLPSAIVAFVVTNLFFTCIAEEAFFRGFLQEKLSTKLSNYKYGQICTIVISGLLFGLVHWAGGSAYVIAATIAGTAYACIYSATRRIEAPIIAHFAFNFIHFVGFTYPMLA